MREYDIFLRDRLTTGKLIVQSIPYRDGVSVTNRILLETMLSYFTVQKFFAVSSQSAFVSEIDELLATVHEIIGNSTSITIDADFFSTVRTELEGSRIGIVADDAIAFERSFFEMSNAVQFRLSDAVSGIKASLGSGENMIGITSSVPEDTKTALEEVNDGFSIQAADLATEKLISERVDDAITIDAAALDLFYRYTTAVEAALSIAVEISDIEIHWSLGDAHTEIGIGSAENGNSAVKYFSVSEAIGLFCALSESLQRFFAVDSQTLMTSEVSADMKRYRKLYEIYDLALADIDNMTLEELYYVYLT